MLSLGFFLNSKLLLRILHGYHSLVFLGDGFGGCPVVSLGLNFLKLALSF